MEVINALTPAPACARGCAIAIGFFDGVHLGHQSLLRTAVEKAREQGLVSVAITFTDHPMRLFTPEHAPPWLTTQEEKLRLLQGVGIDYVHLIDFTWDIANLTARHFAQEVLAEQFKMRHLVCGEDFALGKGREGNVALLRALGKGAGFEVVVVPPTMHGGEVVSSTRIRQLVLEGKVSEARALLGHPYILGGEVVSGRGLGRQIGFPTVNLHVNHNKALPATGVYAVRAECAGATYPAVVNIGHRPTLGGGPLSVEFHLLDAPDFRAPERASLLLMERLREEQKFPSLEALVEQIGRDVERARERLAEWCRGWESNPHEG